MAFRPFVSRRAFMGQLAALGMAGARASAAAGRESRPSSEAEGAITLIREGRALGRIVLSSSAGEEERRAAAELNHHFRRMAGAELELVADDGAAPPPSPAIVLGEPAARLGAAPAAQSPSREGYRLLSRGGLLLIGGESGQAVEFGAYRLLQLLGCEWVMPGEIGEVVPRRATVTVPALDLSEAPAFQYRNLWYGGGRRIITAQDRQRFDQWLRRQRGADRLTPARRTGGHHWIRFIDAHKAEFEADSTMYALRPTRGGELVRRGPQIETTHPRVIELMVEDIEAEFRRRGWPKDRAMGFPIGPSDGLGFSRSPESVAANSGRVDPVSGEPDVTDLVVLLGNTILERLGAEYPNVHVGYYSYSVHGSFPARYRPHLRLVPTFAPIGYSRFHSLLDPRSETQRAYKAALDQWGALARRQGNKMVFRGYSWNLADNFLPYCKARIWGEELPYYAALGIEGLNVEATKAWSVYALSDWVYAQLAWNPNQDWRALVTRYCRAAYGAGADRMESCWRQLIQRQHDANQEAGSYHSFPLIYDLAFVEAAEADLAAAGEAAELDEEKTRISYAGIGIRALRLYLEYFGATQRFDFETALDRYRALHRHWREAYATNPDLVAKEAPQHLERFVGAFAEQAAGYSGGERRLIRRLPDALATLRDPDRRGEALGFPSGLPTEGAAVTRTYSTTWAAQGLNPVAAVWYEHRFRLDGLARGDAPVGLFLGGFDDQARVWLNGREIGDSGRQFSRPAIFDLAPAIRRGGENRLVIEISREDSVNEIGIGGLIRPSFLFVGSIEADQPQVAEPLMSPGPAPRGDR
ncbi:DUF4838 domain-containing protein [Sphingosinicella terrae]|uniref:DUF4838 domain-containing protein n=1 Tax=Sphingosinicella terrae TaxID=2172047 RepID=UPI000E0D9FEB|nr:DUF4838 domain-containing protein [Sphingosinicella terrae]